jgi:hypothetical protein
MPQREDDVAPRTGIPDQRTLLQAGGFALAVAATLVVFLTDNPQFLRLAVVGVAWAFVLATLAGGRRSSDRMAARARESELRRAYELELEREVAARREYELELEAELRREAEEAMRAELDALRDDLAGLSGLRDQLGRVAELRADLTAISGLRDEVARIAALRDDVAALTSLRQELAQVGELRADMGRLRAELTEQLSSEMLVERIVMRTQASRLTSDLRDAPAAALDAAAGRSDDVPPRELTGGWPAVRLDEPRETRQFDQVRVERTPARPPVPPPPAMPSSRPSVEPSWRQGREAEPAPRPWEAPVTASWESRPTPPWETPATASWEPPATTAWDAQSPGSRAADPSPGAPVVPSFRDHDRWSPAPEDRWAAPAPASDVVPLWSATPQADPAEPAPPVAPEPLPSPLEWLAARSLIDAAPASSRPEVPPRRRRDDDALADPAAARTTQRPAVSANPPIRVDDRGAYRVAVREEQPAEPPARGKRLADILAENGVSPSTGGRRRRRYRDEDEPDDVLARVLGSN